MGRRPHLSMRRAHLGLSRCLSKDNPKCSWHYRDNELHLAPPAAPCPWRTMTAFSSERPDPMVTDPVLELHQSHEANGSHGPNGSHETAAAPGDFDLEERQALRRV